MNESNINATVKAAGREGNSFRERFSFIKGHYGLTTNLELIRLLVAREYHRIKNETKFWEGKKE